MDALVDRYAPLIWSICRRHRLDDADADAGAGDVGQAVWLHLVQHLGNLRDPAALPGCLATTTWQECCRVRRASRHLPDDGDVLEKMPDEQTAAAKHELVAAERNAVMREAFTRLPQTCQRLLADLRVLTPK
jgi:DNA-directed RNA polymerase specialized sigma24 family protein